jgi:hypothetical protein
MYVLYTSEEYWQLKPVTAAGSAAGISDALKALALTHTHPAAIYLPTRTHARDRARACVHAHARTL